MDDFGYFYILKDEARKRTMSAVNKRLLATGNVASWNNRTLCSIIGDDIGDAISFASNEWPKYYDKSTHPGFEESWERLIYRYSPRKDHFDLAIWQKMERKQVLVALAIGNPEVVPPFRTVLQLC